MLVLIALLLLAPTRANAQDFPTYAKAAAAPRTVVDYFLLSREFGLDERGTLTFASTADGKQAFEDNKNLLTDGYTSEDFSVANVTIDVPNAYIEVSGVQNGLSFKLTFVLFDRSDHAVLPAFTYYSEGGDSDTYELYVFEAKAPDNWVDVTSRVLPDVSLGDLDTGPDKTNGPYPRVDWEYLLPEKGTTVLAVPHMTYEMDETGPSYPNYDAVDRLIDRKLELVWNRSQGRFTKGKVQ